MAITVTCPSCKKVMKLKDELIGRKIGCLNPQCDHSFVLKASMAEPDRPAAAAKPPTGAKPPVKAPTAKRPPVPIPEVAPQSDPGTLDDLANAVAAAAGGGGGDAVAMESQEFRMFADIVDPGRKSLGGPLPMHLHATDSLVDALDGLAGGGGSDMMAPAEEPPPEPKAKGRPAPAAVPIPVPVKGGADKGRRPKSGEHAPSKGPRPDQDTDSAPRAPVPQRKPGAAPQPAPAASTGPAPASPQIRVNGEAVYLRPLRPADLSAFEAWMDDPEAVRTQICVRALAGARGQPAVPCRAPDGLLLGVCLKDGGQLIGATGLFDIDQRNRSARFEVVFAESISKIAGKGLRTDAVRTMVEYGFQELGLHRQAIQLYENQPAGRKVFELVGFTEEGRQRQAYFCEGKYWDTVTWSLLAPEYFEKKRSAKSGSAAEGD